MLLFEHACVFFWRLLESRNYKIQIVARVGRKSVVALSGIVEASYSHFFIGRGFDCSRGRFRKVAPRPNYRQQASGRSGSGRIEFSSKSTTFLMRRFPRRANSEKKTCSHSNNNMEVVHLPRKSEKSVKDGPWKVLESPKKV